MTNVESNFENIDEPVDVDADAAPYITSPANGALVGTRIVLQGGGHAVRYVGAVEPGTEVFLSDQRLMGGDGRFQLAFLQDPKIGRNFFQILQWLASPESYRRSPVWCVYYMPKPSIISPANGADVSRRPIISGRGAAPGAIMHIVQADSGAVVYAKTAVADNGEFSVQIDEDKPLPLGKFTLTGRYVLDGQVSEWADGVFVNVVG